MLYNCLWQTSPVAACSQQQPGSLAFSSSLIFIQSAEKLTASSKCSRENRQKSVKSNREPSLLAANSNRRESGGLDRGRPEVARPHEAVLTAAEAGGARGRCCTTGSAPTSTSGGPHRTRTRSGRGRIRANFSAERVLCRISASSVKSIPKFWHEFYLYFEASKVNVLVDRIYDLLFKYEDERCTNELQQQIVMILSMSSFADEVTASHQHSYLTLAQEICPMPRFGCFSSKIKSSIYDEENLQHAGRALS